ncbi:MAG: GNAT family N-acetyltransferase [Pirellulales bacterium]
MAIILQLTKRLSEAPQPVEVPGIRLRNYAGTQDVETWLDLRRRAFAREKVGIGNWDAADFEREFLTKPWWRPGAMWLAEAQPVLMPSKVVGTVTLARRGEPFDDKPVVHWLCVLPAYRRRGIGRFLLANLEAAVWDSGERQIWLETHSGWREAFQLYQSLGYEPAAA